MHHACVYAYVSVRVMCVTCICVVLVSPKSGDKADQKFWGPKACLNIYMYVVGI